MWVVLVVVFVGGVGGGGPRVIVTDTSSACPVHILLMYKGVDREWLFPFAQPVAFRYDNRVIKP